MSEWTAEDIAALEEAIRKGEVVEGDGGLTLRPGGAEGEAEVGGLGSAGIDKTVAGPRGMRDWEFEQLVDPSIRVKSRGAPPDILAEGRRLAEEHGERLTAAVFHEATKVSRREIMVWFGSFANFRVELGLRPRPPIPDLAASAEEIEAAYREIVKREGENVTFFQFLTETGWNRGLIVSRFGGYQNLRKRVGLTPRAHRSRMISREELLEDLARVWRSCCGEGEGVPEGRFPTVAAYERLGKYSQTTAYSRYGTWAAVEAAVREWVGGGGVEG